MANRYTGKELYVLFAGTTISGEFIEFTFERTARLVDVTAAGDTHRRQRATTIDGDWTLKVFDHADNGPALNQVLAVGAAGTLIFGPQGNATGQPKFAFEALVTRHQQPYQINDGVVYEFAGIKNGPMLADHGDTF